jgi:uncharacterized membrane protein
MSIITRKILSKEDLQALAQEIAALETRTSGEVRVVLRHHRHISERKLSLHELALKEFTRLGMHRTRYRTGVLILLLVSERQFHIIADEGIHARVPDGTWDTVAAGMSQHFRKGKFRDGIAEAIRSTGDLLAAHFPPESSLANELPNDIIEE